MSDAGGSRAHWTWQQVCAFRLDRHELCGAGAADIPQVAARICGVHAQVMSAAELSVGLRMETITRSEVRQALWTDHSLIKTYGPRGTVHLLAARDLPMWTGALSAVPASGGLPVGVRLTPEELDMVVAAIAEALHDTELTVEELGEAVIASTGPWAGELLVPAFGGMWPRWRIALPAAAARGALCFGPGRGRAVTYVNPIRWLPGFRPEPATAAAGWLLRSYLRSFGPATAVQFARWLATPVPWAADLFHAVADELAAVDVSGSESWLLADDAHAQPPEPRGVRLLPYFDSYVVGSHPRELLFPGPAAARALSRTGQAGTVPVLLVDGVVDGIWHHRRSGRGVGVTVEPFGTLAARHRRELAAQVDRAGEILQATADLTIGPVTIGSHL